MDEFRELPELPNVVQCGTLEDLLHHMAPQQVYAKAPRCWEDAWQQILEAVATEPLPKTVSNKERQSEGADALEENTRPADTTEQPTIDTCVPLERMPSLSCPPKDMWMLHFQVEDDIEAYLETFEWVACTHHWPKEEWVAQLKPYLSHKALLACSVLGHGTANTYGAVKESILRHYGITPEIQRQSFREFRYQEAKGPRKAYQELRMLGWRWLNPERNTKEQILDILLLEQFLTVLPQDMQTWVRACCPQTCAQAVDLAEGFQLRNEPPVPFEDVSVKFSAEEWAFLTKEQQALYHDIMLENFQNVSTLGIPLEEPAIIKQIQGKAAPCLQNGVLRGESRENPLTGGPVEKSEAIKQTRELRIPYFQDGTQRRVSQESLFRESAQVPNSKGHISEKWIVSKKAEMEVKKQSPVSEITRDHLDHGGATDGVFPSLEMQPPQSPNHSPARMSTPRSCPPKNKALAPKGKPHKKKKQQPPTAGEPDSGGKQPQLVSPGDVPGGLVSDALLSTLKQKKRSEPQDAPPKLKKQPVPTGEPSKLKSKNVSHDQPPRLKKQPELKKKVALQEKGCAQLEKQPPLLLPAGPKPDKAVLSVITWHPPFSATVVSDLTCVECGRTFRQRADLRHHRYVHTQEKPYACTVCDKHFRHPSNLHIHLRTHSGEKPYRCPECGKTFSQSCNLRTHRQIHSGSKPFSCCVCGKTFRHRSNLNIHQRIHTGERPYPCSLCPKRFSDRSTLVQHERVHTGERPYACRVCDQRFSQISHLVKHCRVHPGARGPPKTKSPGGHSLSPAKNVFSRAHGKDSFPVTPVNKQDQKPAWFSKTWVSPNKPDPPQTGTAT